MLSWRHACPTVHFSHRPLRRVAGVGRFVADEKPQANLLHTARLADDIRHRGLDYQCQMVSIERILAMLEDPLAVALQCL